MISFDNGQLTMEGSKNVQINASIKIAGTNSRLPIKIVGDFKDVPPHLHMIYMQAMLSSYGDTNVYNNAKEEEPYPMTIKEKQREWRLNKIVDIICKGLLK